MVSVIFTTTATPCIFVIVTWFPFISFTLQYSCLFPLNRHITSPTSKLEFCTYLNFLLNFLISFIYLATGNVLFIASLFS